MGRKTKNQKSVSWEFAKFYPDQILSVHGTVVNFMNGYNRYGTHYRRIALGKRYPSSDCFYIFLNEETERKYPDILNEIVLGTKVIIKGKIHISKGFTSITLEKPSQIIEVDS